ncbi:hypothetical protein BGZ76_000364 [Entomortierella beljakovae]|nr:hypothetical protein BGZ76_000364 [Entomortierella beljakovae]
MNHMEQENPHAHALSSDHSSNPLIIIHATCMITAYGILMPLAWYQEKQGAHEDEDHHDDGDGGMDGMAMRMVKRQAGDTSAEHYGWKWRISAHGALANVLLLLLCIQVGMGLYRKLYRTRASIRIKWLKLNTAKKIHSYLGKSHLILAYIQIVLGFIRFIEACPGQAFGQCISHIVMGGSFWWYGGIYLAYLVGSFPSVSRPEWYETVVMTVWGVINFSILHQWGTRWSHADLQHTSLGLLWIGGGVLSLFIESRFNPLAQFTIRKNPIPALLIILTGYAMGQHAQYYVFATMVHTFFGYTLMLAGVCRLIQLALRPSVSPVESINNRNDDGDDTTLEDEDMHVKSRTHPRQRGDNVPGLANGETPVSAFFGFLSAMGVVSGGLLFQSAHEEQLNITMYYLSDASTYINWIMALAFSCVAFMLILSQIGKKPLTENGSKAYNRIRTNVDSEDRGRSLTQEDIELSGYLAANE